jgi:hypothetical protein
VVGEEGASAGCEARGRIAPSLGGAVPLSVQDGALGAFKEGDGSGSFMA